MLDSKERKFISSSSSIPTPMFFFLFYLFSFYFHFSSPSTVITFLVVRSVTSFSPLDHPPILSILIDPSVSFFFSFFSSFPSSSFYISSFSSFSSSSFFPIFLISRCFPRARWKKKKKVKRKRETNATHVRGRACPENIFRSNLGISSNPLSSPLPSISLSHVFSYSQSSSSSSPYIAISKYALTSTETREVHSPQRRARLMLIAICRESGFVTACHWSVKAR